LAASERLREVAAQEAARVAAATKAREVAVAAAMVAAAAEAEADALERATADGRGSSGAAGPSEASEVAVPDHLMCSTTAVVRPTPLIRCAALPDTSYPLA
jgi:hypothetical protein